MGQKKIIGDLDVVGTITQNGSPIGGGSIANGFTLTFDSQIANANKVYYADGTSALVPSGIGQTFHNVIAVEKLTQTMNGLIFNSGMQLWLSIHGDSLKVGLAETNTPDTMIILLSDSNAYEIDIG